MRFLLFGFWSQHHRHPLTLQLGHHLNLAILLQVGRKAQQQNLALLAEHNRTTTEEYIGLDLGTLLQEVLSVAQLEVVVVVVGLRTETNLLNNHFGLFGLNLLCLFLLLELPS